MKHLYIDTNIIIDFVSMRIPFGKVAEKIFLLAESGVIKLYTCSYSIGSLHYILKKVYDEQKVRKALDVIMDAVKIIPVTEDILRKALRSPHKDYEDAIHILSAHTVKGIDSIVTRDRKDFSTSEIPVYTPDDVLRLIRSK
ncbi:MAG TPA: PIN domain nuclease [Chryseobacterium sp.]|nr:PIN domain nuclease [Chryseobacterium sp.]